MVVSIMVPTAESVASVRMVSCIDASLVGKAEFCCLFDPNGFFCRFVLSRSISLIDSSIDGFNGFACAVAACRNFYLPLLLCDNTIDIFLKS